MSPHVPADKEHSWAVLVAGNLSTQPQLFCPSTLPASDITQIQEVEHSSSFPGYPSDPLEEETQTRKQSRKVILEPVRVLHPMVMGSWVLACVLACGALALVGSTAEADPFTPHMA